jgi:hypothetical protein
MSKECRVAVQSILPQEEVDVKVEINVPPQPGRYVSYFRLCTADGCRFGPKIWADIVAEDVPQPVQTPSGVVAPSVDKVPVKQEEEGKVVEKDEVKKCEGDVGTFAGEMEKLAELGFRDKDRNYAMLVKFNGDIVQAVVALLDSK